MLTKTNICSVQNYLRGTLIVSYLKMMNKMSRMPPLEKFLRTPMNDHAFSLSLFRYFCAFTHYELFVSFRSQNKQNQPASCYYFIKITCNTKCYTQITTMGAADYSKRQLQTVRFPI